MYTLQILNVLYVLYVTQVILQKLTNSMKILCRFQAANYEVNVQL